MTEQMDALRKSASFARCTDVRPDVAEFEAYEPGALHGSMLSSNMPASRFLCPSRRFRASAEAVRRK